MNYHFNTLPQYINQKSPIYAYLTEAFTNEEIEKIIEIGDNKEMEESKIFGSDGFTIDEKVRLTDVSWIDMNKDTEWLFLKLQNCVKYLNDLFYEYNITNFESLQYTCYNKKGSHYDWHSDMQYNTVHPMMRKLSVSLFLTDRDEYEGGDFEYMAHGTSEKVKEDQKGNLIVFPSYLLHRVTPVTKGVRKSLVMWNQGPHFK
jgi:PKHD-type hydroxylase